MHMGSLSVTYDARTSIVCVSITASVTDCVDLPISSTSGQVKSNTPSHIDGVDAGDCTRIPPDKIALDGGHSPIRSIRQWMIPVDV